MTKSTPTSIAELQQHVHHWITTVGHGYFSELTNGLLLCEEAGEVASVLARTHGGLNPKPTDSINLADELADVIWVATAIANQHHIDLTEAIERNINKKNTRDGLRHRPNQTH